MAKQSLTLSFLVLFFILALSSILQVNALGGKVGGRQKIKDVKNNKEVQELGQYCVSEYNKSLRKQHKGNGSGGPIVFSSVVDAEKQVVSGVKYYLKISATTSSGVPKIYDAIVVVQPWVHSKPRQLLNFSPSPATK